VIPYTLDNNDMKYAVPPGFGDPAGWERHLTDAFEVLLAEGRAGAPKMMSVGLHCRLVGRPGRAAALQRFLARVAREKDVWVCRRADIARHWWATHPPQP
jgi:peptidoglycan/xylan/chitin deacetylase (PgdA/CDA1 family)